MWSIPTTNNIWQKSYNRIILPAGNITSWNACKLLSQGRILIWLHLNAITVCLLCAYSVGLWLLRNDYKFMYTFPTCLPSEPCWEVHICSLMSLFWCAWIWFVCLFVQAQALSVKVSYLWQIFISGVKWKSLGIFLPNLKVLITCRMKCSIDV